MELVRIGEKIISQERLSHLVGEILKKRSQGATQQDVASHLGIERSFVSHLERLGEVRRGKPLVMVAFSLDRRNRAEIEKVARDYGVGFLYFPDEKSDGTLSEFQEREEFFDNVLNILADLKAFDAIVFFGSEERRFLLERILDREIISPPLAGSFLEGKEKVELTKDLENIKGGVDLNQLGELFRDLASERGEKHKRGRKRKSWLFKKKSRSRSKSSRRKI